MECKEYRILYTQYEGDKKIGEGISCEAYPSIIDAERCLPNFEISGNGCRQIAKVVECIYPKNKPCVYVDVAKVSL